jgi:rhodanese-related sulfurtransferase
MIVDVRTPAEIAQGRIPGSVPVSLEAILAGTAGLPKDKPLLVVCAVGGRSYAAGLYLARERYPLVYNLRGGMAAWARAGLPLVRGAQ